MCNIIKNCDTCEIDMDIRLFHKNKRSLNGYTQKIVIVTTTKIAKFREKRKNIF